MNHKKITLLTEGGRKFGFGHLTRCLSLCKHFIDYGVEVEFIVHGDESVSPLLYDTQYKILNWLENDTVLEELTKSDFILIDSLEVSNEQILKLESLETTIIYIDDEKRRNILNKGFVLDWTVLSSEKNHFMPKKPDVTYLLGSQYTPLRDSFQGVERNLIKKEMSSVMVTFGGSDVRDLTPKVLQSLVENFPKIKKNIIIGAGFTNREQIESVKDENTNLIYNADAVTMIHIMQESDIAIASGGQTLYELAYMGLPTIAILLVENARDDTEGWAKVGSLRYIGKYNDAQLLTNMIQEVEGLKNQTERQKMHESSRDYISPSGAKLIVETILKEHDDSF